MFVLEKCSLPNTWEFKSPLIEDILKKLDSSVCNGCKMTEAQVRNHCVISGEEFEEYWPKDYKPETYDQWGSLEKVEWLLGTPCGCEFDFYTEFD